MKLYESFVSNLKDSKAMLKEATNDELKLVDSLIQDLDANEGVYDIDDIVFAINHSGISQGAKDAAEEVLDNYSGIGGFLDQAEDEDEKEEILVDANNEAENAIMDFYKTDRDKLANLYHSINESDSKSVIDLARENNYLFDTSNMLQATEKIKNVDGSWFYQRPDSSGRDFFTDVEINSITDDEKNNLVDYCLDGLDSYNWGSYDLDTVNNTLSEELFDTLFTESSGYKLDTGKKPRSNKVFDPDITFSQWFDATESYEATKDAGTYNWDEEAINLFGDFNKYAKTFPNVEGLRNATAQEIKDHVHEFYDYFGGCDSADREKAFNFACDILGCDYDDLYNAWLRKTPLDEAETEEVDSTVEVVEDPNFEDPTKGSLTDEERNNLNEFLADNDWYISFDGDEVFLSQHSQIFFQLCYA